MDVSIVICTHNRASQLRPALAHLLAQRSAALAEVIVVDNNSSDDTAEVVAELSASTSREVRYIFEAEQGISYARNTGWSLARGSVVAFTDDDVRAAPDWVDHIAAAFAAHPEVDCVGGKVLPAWPTPPPSWLTRDHWAPLAIVDYGDRMLWLDESNRKCLIGANVAFRRDVITRMGGFCHAVQRVKDGIGSIEDHEFLLRLWRAGGRALYVPELIVVAPVDEPRLHKRYHRRWSAGHGHFHAVMRCADIERSSIGHLYGVPAHLYRQCFVNAASWVACMASGRLDAAFLHETRLRFFSGFFRTRRQEYLAGESRSTFRDVANLGRSLLGSAYATLRRRPTGAA
jgi:glycosyltransferase involved in cell wall biosynthesis